MHDLERILELPIDRTELFDWHEREGALERLTPSWERIDVQERSGGIRDGGSVRMVMHRGPLRLVWQARHHGYVHGSKFEDTAERSPFAHWHHVHGFEDTPTGARLRDQIEYALPLEPISRWLAGGYARRELERMFRQRHVRTANDLHRHVLDGRIAPMRVGITGASGLVGHELSAFLQTGGHEVVPFVRGGAQGSGRGIAWDPAAGTIDAPALEGLDAVVHLAGESIFGRWTPAKMARILDSRRAGTQLLCEALAACERKPRVLISASAIGTYGDTGDAWVDESSPLGDDRSFLVEVCRAWEAATEPARAAGIRVVNLRLGVVSSARGGVLDKLRLPASLGLGGPIGNGRQFMSWIDSDDLLGVVLHAIRCERLEGPVNAVAPEPVSQRAFAKTLGKLLRRPAFLPLPAFAISALFGRMGREVLLEGQRVRPTRLLETGFRFDFPTLEQSLRHQLGRASDAEVARAVAGMPMS
jgi:uncharacterized protein (TIGR01777 family)